MAEKRNNLAPNESLRGEREDIKAYLGLLGVDDSVMTERHLSPKAVAEMRQTIAKTLATKNRTSSTILNNYPYVEDDTHMQHVVGKVAPSNLRMVDIGGVPYYQLLDRFDFDLGKEGQGTWVNALADGAKQLVQDPRHVLNLGSSGLNSPWAAEQFAGQLGLQRNINYLIPVDPSRAAPAEALEAYRRQTNLPYQPKTLGGTVVNHLREAATPHGREKAMP